MAGYSVVITAHAEKDLLGITDYIADSLREPITAKRQLLRIKETVMGLSDYPTRHSLVLDENLAAKGYRFATADNYLIFYIVSPVEKTVTIIRVLYNRRDWQSLLQ